MEDCIAHFITQYKTLLRVSFLPAVLASALMLSTPLRAQEAVLELDPGQTHIQFTLSDILHTVHGTFKLKRGTIRFDPANGKASGLVVVDVTSGNSGSGARDRRMHKDILQSREFPEATFAPSQMKGSVDTGADSQVEVQGVFNLHGDNHPLTLTFHVHKTGRQLNATTHFVIPYQQWGMKNPSTLFLRVSDKVDIDIQAVGHLTLPAVH
jgi:polyisoprenoid-binding protein YceI